MGVLAVLDIVLFTLIKKEGKMRFLKVFLPTAGVIALGFGLIQPNAISAVIGALLLVGYFVFEFVTRHRVEAKAVSPTVVESVIKLLGFVLKMDFAKQYRLIAIGIVTFISSFWVWISAQGAPILCEQYHILCNTGEGTTFSIIGIAIGALVTTLGIGESK